MVYFKPRYLAWQLAAAAAIIAAAAALWLFIETSRLRRAIEQAGIDRNAAQETARREQQQLRDELARADSQNKEMARQLGQAERERDQARNEARQSSGGRQQTDSILSLVLIPSSLRGSNQSSRLVINRRASIIRFQLDLEDGDKYRNFSAEVKDARGNLLLSLNQLRSRKSLLGRAVTVSLEASQIEAGNYEITLKGANAAGEMETVDFYTFTVVRR
jgi:hypothetical protein